MNNTINGSIEQNEELLQEGIQTPKWVIENKYIVEQVWGNKEWITNIINNSEYKASKWIAKYPLGMLSSMWHDVKYVITKEDTVLINIFADAIREFEKIEGEYTNLEIVENRLFKLPENIEESDNNKSSSYDEGVQKRRDKLIYWNPDFTDEEIWYKKWLRKIVWSYDEQILLAEALKEYYFWIRELEQMPENYIEYWEDCIFVDWDGTLYKDGEFQKDVFDRATMYVEKVKVWTGWSDFKKIKQILNDNNHWNIQIYSKQDFYWINVKCALDDCKERSEIARYGFKVDQYIVV